MQKEKITKTPFSPTKQKQFIHSSTNILPKGELRSFLYLGNSLPLYNPKYNYFYNENSDNDNNNYVNNTLSYYPSNSPQQFLKSKSVNILTSRSNQFKIYKEALKLIDKDAEYIINKSKHKEIFNKFDKQIELKYGKPKHDVIVLTTNPNKEFQFCPYDSFGNKDNNYFDNNIIEYIFTNLNLMGIKHYFKPEITLSDFVKYTEKELIDMKINFEHVKTILNFKKAFIDYLYTKDENDVININDIKNVINGYGENEEQQKLSNRLKSPHNQKSKISGNQYKTNYEYQFDNEVFIPSPKDKKISIQYNQKHLHKNKENPNKKVNSKRNGNSERKRNNLFSWPKVKLIKVNKEKKEEKKSNFIPNKKLRVKAEKLYDRYNLIITDVENYWNKTKRNQYQLSNPRQSSTFSFSSKNTASGSCSNFNSFKKIF